MKRITNTMMMIIIIGVALSGCKKDHTCTCTTTVLGVSASRVYDLPNQTKKDAIEACERFERDANATGLGTTNCNL